MFRRSVHLSPQELLLSADRDLSPWRQAHATRHLAECHACSARMDEIERTLAEAAPLDRPDASSSSLTSAAASRARLRARLTELSASQRPAISRAPRWALASCAVLIAGVALPLILMDRAGSPASRLPGSEPGVFLLPRADLTPGLTRAVSLDEICGTGRRGRTQPIPASVGRVVFASYGADYTRKSEYELDYLVTPELGGAPDARNLWPQPYSRTPWNAYVKDELELHLHELVCSGKLDLATAQREIAADWIAAYRRRFDTDTPRRDYSILPVTADDTAFLLSELVEIGASPHPSHLPRERPPQLE
jgi:hypothetical protein